LGFVDVAVHPERERQLLAADELGGLWASPDGGSSWTRVLAPMGSLDGLELDQEQLLLEAESLARDLLNEEGSEEQELEDESVIEVDTFEAGGASDVDQLLEQMREEAREAGGGGGVVWFHPTEVGLVLFARADGIWRSLDHGRSFARGSDLRGVNDLDVGPGDLLLAATDEGIRYSLDLGRSWIRASGPMDGQVVEDLDHEGLSWYAAGAQGLFVAANGESWIRVGPERGLRAVLADPDLLGGLWLATDGKLLRSDDGGETSYASSKAPLPGTTELLRLGTGHLLQAGGDGVWESRDGGITWRSASAGLPGPQIHALARSGDALLVATPTGLLRLQVTAGERRPESLTPSGSAPLPLVLDSALRRPGMDPHGAGLLSASVLARRVLPEIIVQGTWLDTTDVAADYVDRTNPAGDLERWQATVQLSWGVGQRGGESSYDASDGSDYYVINDQVYATEDSGSVPAAAANVSSEATRYRQRVAGQVMDLYFAHERLQRERGLIPSGDLHALVQHELKIQEVAALLDGYSDGAFGSFEGQSGPDGGS
jgi:hypothetical protein